MIYRGRGAGSHKKTIYRGVLPKKWAWTVHRFKGVLVKEEGSVFQGVDTPMHTMISHNITLIANWGYLFFKDIRLLF